MRKLLGMFALIAAPLISLLFAAPAAACTSFGLNADVAETADAFEFSPGDTVSDLWSRTVESNLDAATFTYLLTGPAESATGFDRLRAYIALAVIQQPVCNHSADSAILEVSLPTDIAGLAVG